MSESAGFTALIRLGRSGIRFCGLSVKCIVDQSEGFDQATSHPLQTETKYDGINVLSDRRISPHSSRKGRTFEYIVLEFDGKGMNESSLNAILL